eukprot:scaffold72389_cov17-Tisochrysis_lutea.AAC.1
MDPYPVGSFKERKNAPFNEDCDPLCCRSSFSGSMSSRDFLLQRQGPAINSVLSSRDSFSLRQAPATNSLTRNKGRFANADAMLERSQ